MHNRVVGWAAGISLGLLTACHASRNEVPATTARSFSVTLPPGASLKSTVLSATSALQIRSAAVVGTSRMPRELGSFGSADHPSEVGSGAVVHGNLWSAPPVLLGPSASVQGAVRSRASIVTSAGAVVAGGSEEHATFGQTPLSWTVNLPPVSSERVEVGPGLSRTLTPGAYGDVRVAPSATLTLGAGTYVFDALRTEPGANVLLDQGAGPVLVYVTGSTDVVVGGQIAATDQTSTNFLLVAFAATNVDLASPWAGTVVAPLARVTMRATPSPHRAQVFGRDIEIASGAVVVPGGFDWSYFCALGDFDGDGLSDCQDACPTDQAKTTPGVCGCGVAETDSDSDGVPDCVDQCPRNPSKTAPGQCGCDGQGAAAGTPCSDGICSGLVAGALTCDGAGSCGDPEACSPDPGNCRPIQFQDQVYWVCGGVGSWAQAEERCSSVPGQSLARIESRQENALVAGLLSAAGISGAAWLGGRDQAGTGTWSWASSSKADGDPFFSGGVPVNGSYVSWSPGSPGGGGLCLVMVADGTGLWREQDCASTAAYVCERSTLDLSAPPRASLQCSDFSPNLSCPAPSTSCVGSDPSFPFFAKGSLGSAAQQAAAKKFADELNACAASCAYDGDPGCAACTGAASIPPAGSRCEPFPSTPCAITGPHGTCSTNADCPSGEVCEFPTGCAAPCTQKQCGLPVKGCAQAYGGERCLQVDLCAPPGSAGNPDPRSAPAADLAPETFDPAKAFTPPPPPTPDYPADPACASPPCALGMSNGWCKYLVPTSLPTQSPSDVKHGESGDGGIIRFDFDPSLALEFKAQPLALGEAKFDLRAAAQLTAGAKIDLGSLGATDVSILDALAELRANRCRASSIDSHVKVFGVDFLPVLAPAAKFDSNPTVLDETKCTEALARFEGMVDRAKKALKDAQELVQQYRAAEAAGKRLPATLCQQIAADPPAGFPPGDCTTESPEATINRFIDFYAGQVQSALVEQSDLAGKVLGFSLPPIALGVAPHEEHQTLFNTTILVGPIPVVAGVQAVERYGLAGSLNFSFHPGSLVWSGSREDVADIWGDAKPFANAGVALFLGVGFDIGVAAASAGVEGMITLGNVAAPVVAGAGIAVQPEADPRPLPSDLAALAGPFPLIRPTQYLFLLKYRYGASVDLTEILKGELDASVRVKFAFFSKTWRAKIVDFGDGFSLPPLVLLQGESGGTALGAAPWARVQMPTPFVSLAKLAVPASPPAPSVPEVAFDASRVEKLFYDSLCTCRKAEEPCFRNADCCAGASPVCFSDPALGSAKVCSGCRAAGNSCNVDSDCCPGLRAGCYPVTDSPGAPRQCTACLDNMRKCVSNDQCCSSFCTSSGFCETQIK
jgi:hypothetical protein